MISTRSTKSRQGFTIVELMIATLIFSVLLVMATSAVIFVSRQFHKGVVINRTQEVARTIAEEISRNIQFSEEDPLVQPGALCMAGKGYVFKLDNKLVDGTPNPQESNNVFVRYKDCMDTSAGSTWPPSTFPNEGFDDPGTELMGKNMRLSKLSITPVSIGGGSAWNIEVIVAYGDTDLLDVNENGVPSAKCRSGTGSHFCSVSNIKQTVVKRID